MMFFESLAEGTLFIFRVTHPNTGLLGTFVLAVVNTVVRLAAIVAFIVTCRFAFGVALPW